MRRRRAFFNKQKKIKPAEDLSGRNIERQRHSDAWQALTRSRHDADMPWRHGRLFSVEGVHRVTAPRHHHI